MNSATVAGTSTWGFSLKNILMIVGGVAAVSAVTVGVNFTLRAWMKNGKRQRAERNVAGPEVGAASAPQLSLIHI